MGTGQCAISGAGRLIKGPLRESAPVSQPEANPKIRSFRSHFLDNTFQRENPMSEITSLVTAEAVKEVLRSEEVLMMPLPQSVITESSGQVIQNEGY